MYVIRGSFRIIKDAHVSKVVSRYIMQYFNLLGFFLFVGQIKFK